LHVIAAVEESCLTLAPIVWACREATRHDGTVTVVFVEAHAPGITNVGAMLGFDMYWQDAHAAALERLRAAEAGVYRLGAAHRIALTLQRVCGGAACQVARLAEQACADIVVVAERSPIRQAKATARGRWPRRSRAITGRVVVVG
jgi:hypothetical protein